LTDQVIIIVTMMGHLASRSGTSPCDSPTIRSTLLLSLVEARPVVQVAFLLRFASAAVSANFQLTPSGCLRLLGGLLAWECAVVAIYLFNGARDVVEDQINGSRRPIAQRRLPADRAVRVAIWAAATALAVALLAGGPLALFLLGLLVLGYLYSAPPFDLRKRLFGANAVATLGGLLTYSAGYLHQRGSTPVAPLLVLAMSMSLWMGVVGAVTKDFGDAAGDRVAGRRTLLAVYGEQPMRWFVALAAPGLGIGFLLSARHWAVELSGPAMVTLVGGVLVGVLAVSPIARGSRARLRLPYHAFMATQVVAHLLILLAAVPHFVTAPLPG
jgi:4-hydroxybenzoate polyprenyltransferase